MNRTNPLNAPACLRRRALAEALAKRMREQGKSILCKEFQYTPSAAGSRILNDFIARRVAGKIA